MDIARKRQFLISAYLLFVLLYYLAIFPEIEPLASHTSTVGLIGDVLAIAAYWIGYPCHTDRWKKPWFWFGITALVYFLGETTWAVYEDFLGLDPSCPSLCDVFYTTNSILSLYAFILYVKQTNIKMKEIAFDLLISLFAVSGILYHFLLHPLLESGQMELLPLVLQLIMCSVDFTFFIGTLLLVFGANARHFFTKRILLMSVSFLGFFSIDHLTLAMDIYEFQTPELLEPFWSFPIFLLGIVSTYPEIENEDALAGHPLLESILYYFRILLPYIFTFAILFLIGIQFGILNPLFLWAILLVMLLSLRQIFVLLRNRRLMNTIQENENRLNLQNTELHRLNQKILHDAEVDFLTQLSNRRHIDQSFQNLTPPENDELSLGMLLIDIDYFKHINDEFGHQIGDFVLKQVAACIRSVIRGGDIAGRYGGDEFIVLLPGADIQATGSVAERLQKTIGNTGSLSSRNVTVSIGCTSRILTRQNYNAELLLRQADDALYQAKKNGRNKIVIT